MCLGLNHKSYAVKEILMTSRTLTLLAVSIFNRTENLSSDGRFISLVFASSLLLHHYDKKRGILRFACYVLGSCRFGGQMKVISKVSTFKRKVIEIASCRENFVSSFSTSMMKSTYILKLFVTSSL